MSITAAYSHKIDEIYASDFASHQQNGLDQITHLQGSRKRPHVEVDAGQQDWQPFSIQVDLPMIILKANVLSVIRRYRMIAQRPMFIH